MRSETSEPATKKLKCITQSAEVLENGEKSSSTSEKPRKSAKDKKRQAQLTLQWLDDNYCACEGVCLPRCILYSHYLDFCCSKSLEPACAATFGKTIRQKFPHITTRRLGTRGHSKYHYYGIGIKESSQYYHTVYSDTGLTRFSGCKFLNEGGFTRKYCLSSKTGIVLPDFPDPRYFIYPATIDLAKISTFLVMYRTHCQCILDSIINRQFDEVPTFLLHFWHGLPDHLQCLVHHTVTVDLIAVCDSTLYKVLIDILVPATMQEMPESLLADIQELAHTWQSWVLNALEFYPARLQEVKLSVASAFSQSLRRQASFLHLAQTVRPILYDSLVVNRIIADVDKVQFIEEIQETTTPNNAGDKQFQNTILAQFKEILHKQATVEEFTEWLDIMLDQHIVKPSNGQSKVFTRKAQDMLISWSQFGAKLTELLTSTEAVSLQSFNVLRLLLDEYVLLVIETQIQQEHELEMQQSLDRHASYQLHHFQNYQHLYSRETQRVDQHQVYPYSYAARYDDPSSSQQFAHQTTESYGKQISYQPSPEYLLTPPHSPPHNQNSFYSSHKQSYWAETASHDKWNQLPVDCYSQAGLYPVNGSATQSHYINKQEPAIDSQGLNSVPFIYESFESSLPAINCVLE